MSESWIEENLMIDMTSEFGRRAARRLREERIIWLTTFAEIYSVALRVTPTNLRGH